MDGQLSSDLSDETLHTSPHRHLVYHHFGSLMVTNLSSSAVPRCADLLVEPKSLSLEA